MLGAKDERMERKNAYCTRSDNQQMSNGNLPHLDASCSSLNVCKIYMREDPKNLEFICKKLCTYSYMFKLQSPS